MGFETESTMWSLITGHTKEKARVGHHHERSHEDMTTIKPNAPNA